MQDVELHLRDLINATSTPYKGRRAPFRAIPSPIVTLIAEKDLESIQKGEIIRHADGSAYLVCDASTLANHLVLSVIPL